jgi:hypothetical protein
MDTQPVARHHQQVHSGSVVAQITRAGTRTAPGRFLAVSSGFGDQVGVVAAWRVDEGVMVSLAA